MMIFNLKFNVSNSLTKILTYNKRQIINYSQFTLNKAAFRYICSECDVTYFRDTFSRTAGTLLLDPLLDLYMTFDF